jgi:hypothetical protein
MTWKTIVDIVWSKGRVPVLSQICFNMWALAFAYLLNYIGNPSFGLPLKK